MTTRFYVLVIKFLIAILQFHMELKESNTGSRYAWSYERKLIGDAEDFIRQQPD